MTNIRIGYEHPDTLITYPDAWFLSRCVVPIQNEGRWIDTTYRRITDATASVLSTAPAHTTYPHTRSTSTIGRYEPTAHRCPALQEYTPNDAYRTAHRFLALQGRTSSNAHPTTRCTPHTSRAPRTTAPGTHPPPTHTKRARTNRSGRATYSAQALGRLPWFAPCLRRSRRLRPRFDMSFSLGLLSRLKHFCTHWPKPPRHRPFAATKVTEKRSATPASSARAAQRDHALSPRAQRQVTDTLVIEATTRARSASEACSVS